MKLFTQYDYAKLLENGKPENQDKAHFPVVKLFTPDAGCTWLLSEIVNLETAFGLCDIGAGFPKLGYVHLPEIAALRGNLGLPVERDLCFQAKYPLIVYARAAWCHQSIVEDDSLLIQFFE